VPITCAGCGVDMEPLDDEHAAGDDVLWTIRNLERLYGAHDAEHNDQADDCQCLICLVDAAASEPPDVDAATLDEGDPIAVNLFNGWRPAIFHRDHSGGAYVEIEEGPDGNLRLRASHQIVSRIRRRWHA
jgi:hypothetical protein